MKESFDILFEEWKQCRASIREFDRTVTHLRSYTVLVTIALLAIGGFFASNQQTDRGLVIEALALAFLFAEYFLATHYRGYLHAVVKRAEALEKLLIPLNSPRIELYEDEEGIKRGTNGMLTEIIGVQRENAYGFLVAEAHNLLYLLLYGVDSALIIFTLSPLSGSGLSVVWTPVIGAALSVAGLYFLALVRIRWNHREQREVT